MEPPASQEPVAIDARAHAVCLVVCDRSIYQVPALQKLFDCQVMLTAGARFISTASPSRSVILLWVEPDGHLNELSHFGHYVTDNQLVPIIRLSFDNVGSGEAIFSATSSGSFLQMPATTTHITTLAKKHGLTFTHGRVSEPATLCASSDRWAVLRLTAALAASPALCPFLLDLADALAACDHIYCNWLIEATSKHKEPNINLMPFLYDLSRSLPYVSLGAHVRLQQRDEPLCFVVNSPVHVYWLMMMLYRGHWFNQDGGPLTQVTLHTVRHLRYTDFHRPLYFDTPALSMDTSTSHCCVCGTQLRELHCYTCQPTARKPTKQKRKSFDAAAISDTQRLPSLLAFAVQAGDVRLATQRLPHCTNTEREAVFRIAALNGHLEIVTMMIREWSNVIDILIASSNGRLERDVHSAGHANVAALLRATQAARKAAGLPPAPSKGKQPGGEGLFAALNNAYQATGETFVGVGPEKVLAKLEEAQRRESEKKQAAKEAQQRLYDRMEELTQAGGNREWQSLLAETDNLLHVAVTNGQIGAVAAILKVGVSPDHKDTSGATPLQIAVRGAELQSRAIPILLNAGAELDRISREGSTPLLEACASGNSAAVAALIAAGAKLSVTDRNTQPPLLVAAHAGHADVIRVLLRAGVDVNAIDLWHGLAALHVAARNGQLEVARALLEGGANVNQTSKHGTPLVLAANFSHTDIAQLLITSGAAINDAVDGRTPLHRACRKGCLPMVKLLVQAGARINLQAPEGYSELHFAALFDDIVEYLLSVGCSPRLLANDGTTALFAAALQGHTTAMERLIRAGADVNAQCTQLQVTALHMAARRGHIDAVELLLSYGASPFITSTQGDTPLHAGVDHIGVVRVLLEAGAPVDAPNLQGEAPLHCMAKSSSNTFVKQLLRAGANPCCTDKEGRTPADIAEGEGRPVSIKLRTAENRAFFAHPRKIP